MRGHGLQGIKCQTKELGAGFQEHWGASEGLGAGEGQGREGRHEEDQGAASQPTGTGNWVRAAGHTEGLGPGGWGWQRAKRLTRGTRNAEEGGADGDIRGYDLR